MFCVVNGDSPIGRRVGSSLAWAKPQVQKTALNAKNVHLTYSGSGVITTTFQESTSVVSRFTGENSQSIESEEFESRFDSRCDALLDCTKYSVTVYSFYTAMDGSSPQRTTDTTYEGAVFSGMPKVNGNGNVGISDTVCYAGSGTLFNKNGNLYVLTARNNILSKRRPAPDQPHYLLLKTIRVTFPRISVTRIWRNATRCDITNVDADLRTSHTISFGGKWRHNSDFAVLKVGEDPNNNSRNACVFPHSLPFAALIHGIKVAEHDEIYVYGVPAAVSKEEHKQRQPNVPYKDFIQIFHPGELHVSYGKVTHTHETMCSYNANTAGGMSGGPVFLWKDSVLHLVGLHVGGYSANTTEIPVGMNQFVPLTMPALARVLENI